MAGKNSGVNDGDIHINESSHNMTSFIKGGLLREATGTSFFYMWS